jgi:predicted TIM-barrel fold metal-dependent hydrolase
MVYHSDPALTLVEGASYADGLQRLVEAHSLGFLISNQIQLTSVLMQGVPERFPKLKFMFQESGVFWVPTMMYRLDEYYLKRREEAPLLQDLPSQYILDRFYFGTQPIEMPKNRKYLEAIFEMANGRERFVFASDYPHFDYDDPIAILGLPFLDAESKANVLAGNAQRVFNLRRGGIQPWESTLLRELGKSPIETASS